MASTKVGVETHVELLAPHEKAGSLGYVRKVRRGLRGATYEVELEETEELVSAQRRELKRIPYPKRTFQVGDKVVPTDTHKRKPAARVV